jgi:hypothetical protein
MINVNNFLNIAPHSADIPPNFLVNPVNSVTGAAYFMNAAFGSVTVVRGCFSAYEAVTYFPEIALLFFRAMWSSFHAGGKGIQAAERVNWKAVSNFKELWRRKRRSDRNPESKMRKRNRF